MGTQGVFGYVIDGKRFLMHVQYDADMLWGLLLRELYILMKHYGYNIIPNDFYSL